MKLINIVIGFFIWLFSFEDERFAIIRGVIWLFGFVFLGTRLSSCAGCSGGGSHEPIDWLRGY